MLVMGCIVGAGVFRTPRDVAAGAGSLEVMLGLWIFGGVFAIAGAFVFAELGALFPKTGGQYVFLREGLGRFVAFMFGWILLAAISSSAIAYVSRIFVDHLEVVLQALRPGLEFSRPLEFLLAIALLGIVSALNIRGIKLGALTQNLVMGAKVLGLMFVIALGFFAWATGNVATPSEPSSPGSPQLGPALLAVVFCYGGFQNVAASATEIRRPTRTIPLAILAGTSTVIVLYVLLNLSLGLVLGVENLGKSSTPVAEAAGVVFPRGDLLVAGLVLVSTFGINQALFLVIPRIFYAMARDGLFFRGAARVHQRYSTPAVAILILVGFTCLHLSLGEHVDLLQVAVVCDWLFFGLCGVALLVFRRRHPRREGKYLAPGHPWLAAVFLTTCLIVIVSSLFQAEPIALIRASVILLIGLVLFLLWNRSTPFRQTIDDAEKSLGDEV